jgi:urease accessory protein UreF
LWIGIFFTLTFAHPTGCVIYAALWPLIADILAMRKTAGFAAHSATFFCAHCALTLDQQDSTDVSQWPKRVNHQTHAEEWRDAPNEKGQEKIFADHGVQYTVLSKLPYWRPIEFVTVDIMHCVLLGLLSDHAQSFLRLKVAGQSLLSKQQINACMAMPFREPIPNSHVRNLLHL